MKRFAPQVPLEASMGLAVAPSKQKLKISKYFFSSYPEERKPGQHRAPPLQGHPPQVEGRDEEHIRAKAQCHSPGQVPRPLRSQHNGACYRSH